MKTSFRPVMFAALVGAMTFSLQAQSPQTPEKTPGTQPAKDGSGAQKQSPEQPGGKPTPNDLAQSGKEPTSPPRPGAGSSQPIPSPQSPEQKPQQPAK